MTTYQKRTIEEQDIIHNAIEFEVEAIQNLSTEPNPYKDRILQFWDGKETWEAIEEYIENWVR